MSIFNNSRFITLCILVIELFPDLLVACSLIKFCEKWSKLSSSHSNFNGNNSGSNGRITLAIYRNWPMSYCHKQHEQVWWIKNINCTSYRAGILILYNARAITLVYVLLRWGWNLAYTSLHQTLTKNGKKLIVTGPDTALCQFCIMEGHNSGSNGSITPDIKFGLDLIATNNFTKFS